MSDDYVGAAQPIAISAFKYCHPVERILNG